MTKSELVITISGTISFHPTSRPTTVAWSVTAAPGDAPEIIGNAITEACRELNKALKEAVK